MILGKIAVVLPIMLVSTACSFHSSVSNDSKKLRGVSYSRCAYSLDRTSVQFNSQSPCDLDDTIIHWPNQESQSTSSLEVELYEYLKGNLMPFDIPNTETLGFSKNSDESVLPDGLSQGIIGPTISLSVETRLKYPWTFSVPKEIFFEYVGTFANVNEARTNWRPYFHDKISAILDTLVESNAVVEDVVNALDDEIWTLLSKNSSQPIFFKPGQTPLIYDPMSIITFGYASCTGLSILLINILRTAGIPARLAGTDAWHGKKENGNHSWVEFYGSDNSWHIMESKPASGRSRYDDLLNPCRWWFCNSDKIKDTTFYAARYDRSMTSYTPFSLAWDYDNLDVVGEDRTSFMKELCARC